MYGSIILDMAHISSDLLCIEADWSIYFKKETTVRQHPTQ